MKKLLRFALMFVLIFALVAFVESVLLPAFFDGEIPAAVESLLPAQDNSLPPDSAAPEPSDGALPDEDGVYDGRDELALYIHNYGHLPPNFVTKREAEAAGWSGGALNKVLPGKCIGGDRFGNREGLLPSAKGREWTECDVNTLNGSSRGPERLVFSNDGLIYYTPDHYESFTLLYGEP